MSRIQVQTGETLFCKHSGCGKSYYAAPSRAKRNALSEGGYCSPDCAYTDRQVSRKVCPVCGESTVKHPNVYCSLECYHGERKQRQIERKRAKYANL